MTACIPQVYVPAQQGNAQQPSPQQQLQQGGTLMTLQPQQLQPLPPQPTGPRWTSVRGPWCNNQMQSNNGIGPALPMSAHTWEMATQQHASMHCFMHLH